MRTGAAVRAAEPHPAWMRASTHDERSLRMTHTEMSRMWRRETLHALDRSRCITFASGSRGGRPG
jgi:hypothetical protein